MQASGPAAMGIAGAAVKMLIVQDERLQVVLILSERVHGSCRAALAENRFADLGRKSGEMCRIVIILVFLRCRLSPSTDRRLEQIPLNPSGIRRERRSLRIQQV
jgi:hypothetical protein